MQEITWQLVPGDLIYGNASGGKIVRSIAEGCQARFGRKLFRHVEVLVRAERSFGRRRSIQVRNSVWSGQPRRFLGDRKIVSPVVNILKQNTIHRCFRVAEDALLLLQLSATLSTTLYICGVQEEHKLKYMYMFVR